MSSIFALALGLAACGDVKRPDGGHGLLAVAERAPDFAALDAVGKPVRLGAAAGTRVVYFYPQGRNPGLHQVDDGQRGLAAACAGSLSVQS